MTPLDPQLLDILVCPETKQPVRLAPADLVTQANGLIAKGLLKNRSGVALNEALSDGLVRQDGQVLYPVRQDIPIMLVEEAIGLPLGK